jgi:acetyl esterase/lipase
MNPAIPSLLVALLSLAIPARAQQRMPAPQPQAPATPSFAGEVTVHENVVYGSVNGTDLKLDVYEPADATAGPYPAVILIHGGGWISFDKSTMHGMGQFLGRSGYVAFSVDYRLFHGKDNLWPAQLDDVQRAVRWIRANAKKYDIDPQKIGAFGHSAGAQLAALLGMEDTRDNSDPALAKYSSRVQAVVDVSGPTDFTVEHDPEGVAFLTSFLGVAYDKAPEVWQKASPALQAARGDAPFLIFHGTKDQDVPMAQAQELYDKLHAAKVTVALEKVDDEHTFRTPEARRQLALESLDFFNRYLGVH